MASSTLYPGSSSYPDSTTYPGTSTSAGDGATTLQQPSRVFITFTTSQPSNNGSAVLTVNARTVTSFTANGATPTGPTLYAVADAVNMPPRVALHGINLAGSTVRIYRVNPDGSVFPVRQAEPAPLNGNETAGIYDYEVPFNQAVTYRAIGSGSAVPVVSGTVTVPYDGSYLSHPGLPDLSRPVTVRTFSERSRRGTSVGLDIIGRRTPITHSEGQRKAPQFTVTLATETEDDADDLLTLVDDESVLLLQVADPNFRSIYEYVSIKDMTEADLIETLVDSRRVWTLPCDSTDRPAGAIQAQRTMATVRDENTTIADIKIRYATMRGVLTGTVGS